jgi:hypothetical protein
VGCVSGSFGLIGLCDIYQLPPTQIIPCVCRKSVLMASTHESLMQPQI